MSIRPALPSPLTRSFLAAWSASVLALGLLLFTYRYLEHVAAEDPIAWQEPLINELSAALGAGLVFFGWRALAARAPLTRTSLARRAPLYLAAWLGFSALHTSWNWGTRALLYPLADLGAYDYGRMPTRYWMELPADTILSVAMVAGLSLAARMRAAREHELAHERLAARLDAARLEALSLRLQPHFLFNALNTISATMYTDVEAADRMLERLAHLLRAVMSTAGSAGELVPLAEELELLEDYLALVRARFAERLVVELEIEPGLEGALVPRLVLQPLVENCVRHGGVEQRGHGRVRVRARAPRGELRLSVEDDGPGPGTRTRTEERGHGLELTAERLRLHFGARGRLATERSELGGFAVTLHLPLGRPVEGRDACAS